MLLTNFAEPELCNQITGAVVNPHTGYVGAQIVIDGAKVTVHG